jgi:hypothetical protein
LAETTETGKKDCGDTKEMKFKSREGSLADQAHWLLLNRSTTAAREYSAAGLTFTTEEPADIRITAADTASTTTETEALADRLLDTSESLSSTVMLEVELAEDSSALADSTFAFEELSLTARAHEAEYTGADWKQLHRYTKPAFPPSSWSSS